MRPVIIVFAKAPVPGRVKTRLTGALTGIQAAALHSALVLDQIEALQQLADIDLELHTDIPTDAWGETGVARSLQCEGDLQLKLLHALNAGLRAGRPRVTVIGSDSPALPPEYLGDLSRAPEDVSLGPAEDGGFWGISCARTHPAMFEGVTWSSSGTLRQTMAACRRCGLGVSLGREWWDVDEPGDLERLIAQPGLGRNVRSCIESPEWRASCGGIDPGSRSVRRQSP